MRAVLLFALIAAAVFAALGWRAGHEPDAPVSDAVMLRPDDARLAERGRQIYMAHCAACHGVQLEGQPDWRVRGADGRLPAPPHDAGGHTWHHADELLFRITKHGVGPASGLPDYDSAMPAYAGVLSDEEIVAVLSWIKSQWPADVRALHDQVNARTRHGG